MPPWLSFAAPGMAWGLLGAALPLAIHLISRRRPRVVAFAALQFLNANNKRTTRRFRLQQWLLLALRTLAAAALAFALMGPRVGGTGEQGQAPSAPSAVVFVLDVTASMGAKASGPGWSGETLFDHAKTAIARENSDLPADAQRALLLCGRAPEQAALTFGPGGVTDALGAAALSDSHGQLAPCIDAAAALLDGVPPGDGRHVVVVSDLAAHALRATWQSPPDMTVRFVLPGTVEPGANAALVDAALERDTRLGDARLSVRFTLALDAPQNQGLPSDHNAHAHTVELVQHGRVVSSQQVAVQPGMTTDAAFSVQLDSLDEGAPLVLRLPADTLARDNTLTLPIVFPPPVRVRVVDGAPSSLLHRGEVYFLSRALRAQNGQRTPLEVRVVGPSGLGDGLSETDVVVLANVASLPDDDAAALTAFVERGGGLLVTAGARLGVQWANTRLGALLPGTLRGEKSTAKLGETAGTAETGLRVGAADMEHPALRGLRAPNGTRLRGDSSTAGLIGLRDARTHTYMLSEPGAQNTDRSVLLRFENGAPLLSARRVGQGRVMFWATTVDRDWSDIAIRPGFLPLMQQLVLSLAGALGADDRHVFAAGQAVDFIRDPGLTALTVLAPGGVRDTWRPTSPADDTWQSPDARHLRYMRTHAAGLYTVELARGGAAIPWPEKTWSVHIPAAESQLQKPPADALRAQTGQADVPAGAAQTKSGALHGLLMALVAAMLLGEAALLHARSRRSL